MLATRYKKHSNSSKRISEMLKELPEVSRKVDNYIQQLQRGELSVAQGKARGEALTQQSKDVLAAGTKEAQEAKAIADKLMGDKFAPDRIKQFLQTSSPSEWERIAPYIAQNPQREDFVQRHSSGVG
jgi:hypothetical protein